MGAYLWALLKAGDHQSSVPHFADLQVYLRILGDEAALRKLEDQQKKRQTKRQKHVVALADMDDWEVPVPERKRGKRNPRGE